MVNLRVCKDISNLTETVCYKTTEKRHCPNDICLLGTVSSKCIIVNCRQSSCTYLCPFCTPVSGESVWWCINRLSRKSSRYFIIHGWCCTKLLYFLFGMQLLRSYSGSAAKNIACPLHHAVCRSTPWLSWSSGFLAVLDSNESLMTFLRGRL